MNTSSRWDSRPLDLPGLRNFVRRGLFILLLALALTGAAWGQSTPAPLVLYPIADPLIYLGGGAIELAGHYFDVRKPAPDIAALSPTDIPAFDRLFYSTYHSEPLSIASDVTVAGTVLLPLVLVPHLSRSELLTSIAVYAESLGLSYALKDLLKGLIVRYRPYAYGTGTSPALLAGPGVENSFPSGHVTVAFAAAVAGGYIFDLYDTNRRARIAMWTTALGLASATAVLRVWSGNHFATDVIAAAGLGSLVGGLLTFVHSPSSLAAIGLPVPSLSAATPSAVNPTALTPAALPILQWGFSLP